MKKKLVLHLGAHKTATTYIQDTLVENNAILQSNDIYCISRDDFREKISRKYFYPNKIDEKIEFTLNDYLEDKGVQANNIILSEENLIGLVQEQITGNLYQSAKERLRKIKKFVGDEFEIVAIIFCVRSYSNYYPSLYCETLKSIKYYHFNKVKKNIANHEISWKGIIDDIDDVFPNKVQVWEYEKFRDNQDAYFKKIMFDMNIEIKPVEGDVRKGFGSEVVDILNYINRKYGQDFLTSKMQKKLIINLSSQKTSQYSPFHDVEKVMLDRAYFQDIESLKKQYDFLKIK